MFPALYQIHTRAWLHELGRQIGRPATLDDVKDDALDQLTQFGFDFVWLLGVWQTGEIGRNISRGSPQWQEGFREDLPDYTAADICGSCFAIQNYAVHADFGGDAALLRLRERLAKRGLRLMLDFVPSHTALDHAWVDEHPEFFVAGTDDDLAREPLNYVRLAGRGGKRIFAHGRDPYFPGWRDTLQLNYRHGGLRQAMIGELLRIAELCDGVRCDMAMLVLPNVFKRTWGDRAMPGDRSAPNDAPFWPEALDGVRGKSPEFVFLSEVYWDLEATLQAQGFDYTYDKSYYDRLLTGDAEVVRDHLLAEPDYQRRSARFLENHDEPRAAAAFDSDMYQAAAVLTYTVPGLRFFYEGQFEGRRKHANVHLRRRAEESVDPLVRDFYGRLFSCIRSHALREGRWRLLDRREAWEGNPTWRGFIAYEWRSGDRSRQWIVVNFGPTQGQCYVDLSDDTLRGRLFDLRDQMSRAKYERDGHELASRGLYLDMPAWSYHVFDVKETG